MRSHSVSPNCTTQPPPTGIAACEQGTRQQRNLVNPPRADFIVNVFRFFQPSTSQVRRPALLELSVVAVAALLTLAQAAYGQVAKIQIDHLEKLANKAAEVTDVTLDGPMLRLAGKFMDKDSKGDAEMKQFIQNLKGVYVKSFEFDKEGEYSQADLEVIRDQLHGPEWQRIVGVESKRERERTEIYLMGSGDNIKGMTIIAAEPRELTVVNLVGPIDLERLSKLEGHLGVPQLGVETTHTPRPARVPKPPATSTKPGAPSPPRRAEGGPDG
jgi:Domain of unknown function (DUF4252)